MSEEQNKATKERKATLKSLKIQTLQAQGADTSRGVQSTPPRGRAHVRTTSMPYLPSRLAPAAPIQGWVPQVRSPPLAAFLACAPGPDLSVCALSLLQYDSFASSSAPASAGLSSRPFPSVLAGTPVHAAYIANTGRASPAEQQTYSHAVEQAHAHGPLAATPPRSRSPSPAHQFPPSLNATYSRSGGVPAGYTSYFPQTPYSPTEEASVSGSSFTSSTHSPTTPFTPFEPAFHYQQQARDPKFALASHEMASSFSASSSSSLGIHIAPGHQQHQQAHYHSPSLGSAAHAYAPPSPTRKPRHPALHRATQSLGGNPGLGFDLPLGFAPDMPVDPAFERAVSGLSACQIAYDAGHAEEEVTYSWGTA